MYVSYPHQIAMVKPRLVLFLLLTVFLTSSCNSNQLPIKVEFELRYQNQPVTCHSIFSEQNWQVSQLQFYLHGLSIKDTQGNWYPLDLTSADSKTPNIALLGGVCPNRLNLSLLGYSQLNEAKITAIKFKMGVPSKENHKNPITQAYPLNQADMFWVWQTGHKFLRLELQNQSKQWAFHLGSTGCQSASPVRPPKQPCRHPNLVNVLVEKFSNQQKIIIHLDQLLGSINLEKSSGCQSDRNNPDCRTLFKHLNVDSLRLQSQVFQATN
jgi:uncharacterized repeat protein (TIGR04052 family)